MEDILAIPLANLLIGFWLGVCLGGILINALWANRVLKQFGTSKVRLFSI